MASLPSRSDLARTARALGARAVAFALPPRCPGCGQVVAADHVFCVACWGSLDFLGRPACGRCGEPIELATDDGSTCGACLADPPPFDRLRAAVAYGEIARRLALKLKHGRRPGLAKTMARLMERRARELAGDGAPLLIAPVPLHRGRLWSRGYNQAALIAGALVGRLAAEYPGTELAVDLIERRAATPMLRGLGRKARARTLAGAFAINPRWAERVRGRRILLIDDVHTTGATARGCAKALAKAGVSGIDVLCWARVSREEAEVGSR